MIFKEKIAIIGAGVMGSLILELLIKKTITTPTSIIAIDKNSITTDKLKKKYPTITVKNDVRNNMAYCGVVFICVKPADTPGVMKEIGKMYGGNTIVISIAAGVSIERLLQQMELSDKKPLPKMVRLMPNTPSLIGKGAGAFYCYSNVKKDEIKELNFFFEHMGTFVELDDEDKMHAVTALSGSGPAFVSVLLESFVAAGVRCGLDSTTAYTLAHATMQGTLDYMKVQKLNASAVCKQVSSPNGTTAEGLFFLEKANVRHAIAVAVAKACEKSKNIL